MTLLTVAIVVHVLSVVWWIGGLAFVTAVILPALRAGGIADPRVAFESIESRFALQARVAVILVGLSGLYLLIRLDFWTAFFELRFWWLDPGGHLKFPHPWPGQNPPVDSGRTM